MVSMNEPSSSTGDKATHGRDDAPARAIRKVLETTDVLSPGSGRGPSARSLAPPGYRSPHRPGARRGDRGGGPVGAGAPMSSRGSGPLHHHCRRATALRGHWLPARRRPTAARLSESHEVWYGRRLLRERRLMGLTDPGPRLPRASQAPRAARRRRPRHGLAALAGHSSPPRPARSVACASRPAALEPGWLGPSFRHDIARRVAAPLRSRRCWRPDGLRLRASPRTWLSRPASWRLVWASASCVAWSRTRPTVGADLDSPRPRSATGSGHGCSRKGVRGCVRARRPCSASRLRPAKAEARALP
jgi:hypothetical protein